LSSLEALLKTNFKLSLYEARAYIALLRGAMNAREVAQASGVPLPRVYDTLRSLEEKGFAEEAADRFQALPPKHVMEGRLAWFDEIFRREQVQRAKVKDQLLKALGPLHQHGEPLDQEVHLLKGINTIANRFREMLEASSDIMLGVRKAISAKDLFKPYLERATGKRVRLLVSRDVEVTGADEAFAQKAGAELRRCGFLLFDVMVADDRDVVIGVPDPLSDEVYRSIAIWVRNSSFARSVRESLEELWDLSDKVTTQSKHGRSTGESRRHRLLS